MPPELIPLEISFYPTRIKSDNSGDDRSESDVQSDPTMRRAPIRWYSRRAGAFQINSL